LYRNRPVKVTLLLLLVFTFLWGQRKPVRGPRATALVVLSADGKTAVRLIPICIRDNDHFWDASIYQASPRPMALEPGTVYEMERTGNPIGLFTISQAAQENGNWIALGSWQTPRPRTARTSPTSDDERPVLRRAPAGGAAPSAPEPPPAADDSDRPVLHRTQPSAAATQLPEPPPPVSSDPDRPLLKRGKPAPGSEPAPTAAPLPAAPAANTAAAKPKAKPPELVPAISDAGGPDPHPFVLERNADEEARLRKAAAALVEEAVLKQAGLTSTAARVDFKDATLKYFDLDGNNAAELVLTTHLQLLPQSSPRPAPRRTAPRGPSVALRDFYVTFVAREDLNGEVHPSFTRITDARNLDLDGRFELIDAVDVDGDGRGELLFRRLIGSDVSYVVLKVGLSQTTKLFDSAGEQ
jgi:hypothetical protein